LSAPNAITLARLALTPLIAAAIWDERWRDALILFVIAGASDGVDGFLARRFNMRTELGAFLDPLADKALLMTIYLALAVMERIPGWLAATVVGRDVVIMAVIGALWAAGRRFAFRPLLISKANTALQIGYAVAVLAALAFAWPRGVAFEAAAVATGVFTLLSFAAYLVQWSRYRRETLAKRGEGQ
jgi:cardiolipin synthase